VAGLQGSGLQLRRTFSGARRAPSADPQLDGFGAADGETCAARRGAAVLSACCLLLMLSLLAFAFGFRFWL
jgi:hypothetical protein